MQSVGICPCLLLALTTVAANLTACIAIYTCEPVRAMVLDAESGTGIPGAAVTAHYPHPEAIVLNHPPDVTAYTDESGLAVVDVADYRWGFSWNIAAPGYLAHRGEVYQRGSRIPPEFRAESYSTGAGSAPQAVIKLYREPQPCVVVVVPDGYRGPLGVRLKRVQTETRGEREFVFRASERGLVRMEAPPLLLRGSTWSRFSARYASGELIPTQGSAPWQEDWERQIALRWGT